MLFGHWHNSYDNDLFNQIIIYNMMGFQNLQYFDSDFDLENQSRSWFWTKITFYVPILYLKRTRQYGIQEYGSRVQGLSINLKNPQGDWFFT